jgi:hypothetical protein
MSLRTTRCLTWGEMRRSGETLRDESGRWVGHISFGTYVTLCGRHDENPTEACQHLDAVRRARPVGVCRPCWSRLRVDVADMHTVPTEVTP